MNSRVNLPVKKISTKERAFVMTVVFILTVSFGVTIMYMYVLLSNLYSGFVSFGLWVSIVILAVMFGVSISYYAFSKISDKLEEKISNMQEKIDTILSERESQNAAKRTKET